MNWLWTYLSTKSEPVKKTITADVKGKIKEKQKKLSQERGNNQAKASGAKLFKNATQPLGKESAKGKPSIFERLKKRPEIEEEKAKKKVHVEYSFVNKGNQRQFQQKKKMRPPQRRQ